MGHGLVESPGEVLGSGRLELGRIDSQISHRQAGRPSQERGPGIKKSSKQEAIKIEKREKIFKEQLIRHFNQKQVDKVVSALKAKAKEELGHVEEEQEAAEEDSNPLSDKADSQKAQ